MSLPKMDWLPPLSEPTLPMAARARVQFAGQPGEIFTGGYAFSLMDGHGIPFSVLVYLMEEKGWAFDLYGFCVAALRSANFTIGKVHSLLKYEIPEELKPLLKAILMRANSDATYDCGGWKKQTMRVAMLPPWSLERL